MKIARITLCTAALTALIAIPELRAQTATAPLPCPCAQSATAAGTTIVIRPGQRCVTVRVCPTQPAVPTQPAAPGRFRRMPAPPPVVMPPPPPAVVPPAPPAAPQAGCAAPAVPNARYVPFKRPAPRKPLRDPARSRLAISPTAEVLDHGQWEWVGRQLGLLMEMNVGLGNRFQLGVKTAPIMWLIPGIGFKGAFYAAELRAQIWRGEKFKLALDATYFHVMNGNGLRAGLTGKLGGEKLAFHFGVGTTILFADLQRGGGGFGGFGGVQGRYNYDVPSCAGPVEPPAFPGDDTEVRESYYAPGCGSVEYAEPKPIAVVNAMVGLEVRFWRHGKFFLEGIAARAGLDRSGTTVLALLPGVRLHGKGFAADLSLGVLAINDIVLPYPTINLSYAW